MLVSVVALLSGTLVGFGAGLFSFRVKGRWCPDCGDYLRCLDCLRRKGVGAAGIGAAE